MTILKRSSKRKRKDEKSSFLGITIPKKLSDYLSLFSIAKGVTKSSIIKGLLIDWNNIMQEDYSEDDLVHTIGIRAYTVWCNAGGKRANLHTFKNRLKLELKSKGLEHYTDAVIKIMEDEKSKNEGDTTS